MILHHNKKKGKKAYPIGSPCFESEAVASLLNLNHQVVLEQ